MALHRVCGFFGTPVASRDFIFPSAARLFPPKPPTHRAERTSSAKMADAAAAEMQQMKVEEEKKEVVTALAGAFGVAPPVDNGCVARDPTLFLAPTLRRRSRSPAGAGTIDRPGSRRTAHAWRARRALCASSFAPFDPPPERLPPRRARRVAHAPTSRSAD
jgi:hypothetical protein